MRKFFIWDSVFIKIQILNSYNKFLHLDNVFFLPKNYIDDVENECFVKKVKRGAPKKTGKALEFD